MSTENRSSNTEMVSVPRGLIEQLEQVGEGSTPSRAVRKDALEQLYVYASCTQPARQPHPDPIAWMVGTAFWWTKEEAERDAAETGLPIVGLGPMAGIAPAEQRQGEPVALPERKDPTQHWVEPGAVHKAQGWNACLDEIAKLGPLYSRPVEGEPVAWLDPNAGLSWLVDRMTVAPGTKLYPHADPSEVERLRGEVRRLHEAGEFLDNVSQGIEDKLRAQLAEAQALLGAIAGWTEETRAAVLEAFQDELNESASYEWYDSAIADLMKLIQAVPASAELSAPAVSKLPELTNDLREILGRPNFTCHYIAKALRIMGHSIAPKSEDEQAVVIHWLLGHYLKNGSDWRLRAEAELKSASDKLAPSAAPQQ